MLSIFIKDYLLNLKRNQWKKREELDKYTFEKLKECIENAYENVPYYQKKFKKLNISSKDFKTISDIQKFPITTKKDIIASNHEYVSKKYDKSNLKTSRTSGSTGEPFVSYFDNRAWDLLKIASKMRARFACKFSHIEKYVVIEAMTIDEAKEQNKSRNMNIINNGLYLSVYDSLDSHMKVYEKFKPKSIYGFPSYFLNLAEYMEKSSIKLDYIEKLYTSSEILDIATRKKIESVFNCEIYDIYGCTEIKEIAWECPKHEGYHINEDLVYVEILDENNNPVKPGEIGRIVVTSLQNDAMPLIRYSIGDTGMTVPKKCSCRRTFKMIKPGCGRVVDYFILKNGKKLSPYELTMSVEGIEGIRKYQIVQKTKEKVEIYLKISDKFKEESKKIIEKNLKKILGNDVEVKVKIVKSFQKDKNYKFRVVKTEVK